MIDSKTGITFLLALRPAWEPLLGPGPLPPGPVYMFSAAGLATALIGMCLRWSACYGGHRWLCAAPLQALGRCTLSVYIAHIFVGMGTLEAIGWLSGRSLNEVLAVGLVFGVCALLVCWAWLKWAKHGPLESLLRWISRLGSRQAPRGPGAARP